MASRVLKLAESDGWAWDEESSGTNARDLGGHVFKPQQLQPLTSILNSTLRALGHATSAHSRLVKLKSREVSPDGQLGGRGYVRSIPNLRKQLMNCVEVLSAISDTLYDEVHAPHWNPVEEALPEDAKDELDSALDQAEEIRKDPEAWAEDEEEEDSVPRTASQLAEYHGLLLSGSLRELSGHLENHRYGHLLEAAQNVEAIARGVSRAVRGLHV